MGQSWAWRSWMARARAGSAVRTACCSGSVSSPMSRSSPGPLGASLPEDLEAAFGGLHEDGPAVVVVSHTAYQARAFHAGDELGHVRLGDAFGPGEFAQSVRAFAAEPADRGRGRGAQAAGDGAVPHVANHLLHGDHQAFGPGVDFRNPLIHNGIMHLCVV